MIEEMVSVIVPTHNRSELLRQAVDSIVRQCYPLIEIIVIANGCRDDTESIVAKIQYKHPKTIIFLKFDETLGGGKARNIGIDKAQGEYIAFLDDDDRWHPDKLATQVKLLNEYRCSIVGTNFYYLYGKGNHPRPAGRLSKGSMRFQDLFYENSLGGFSLCLTKKSYIGDSRINEHLEALQDWDLWCKIAKNTNLPLRISPAYHGYSRIDRERISNRYSNVVGAQQLFLQQWQNDLDDPSINYHKMRIFCHRIKIQRVKKLRRYVMNIRWVIKTIYNSPERLRLKRYVHYLLLPFVDIDAIRIFACFRIRKFGVGNLWNNNH